MIDLAAAKLAPNLMPNLAPDIAPNFGPSFVQFPPTRAAALERIAAIDARAYARTRNALDGAVTRLSPYITHGYVSVPDVIASLHARGVRDQEKIIFELGWREYWHHVWRHLGDGIFTDQREPISQAAYATTIPADILEARTGVPVIDATVRTLYSTGYIHNHARMWLASYVVHLRKVAWRGGADWMIAHLLDGDLAANHLSWQWVAGTFTAKPYLFNDENVARYAPDLSMRGTAIDRSYAELDDLARANTDVGPEPNAPRIGIACPPIGAAPPALTAMTVDARGRSVWLIHPWQLGEPPGGGAQRGELPRDDLCIGYIDTAFHMHHRWSAQRWHWVLTRMRELCSERIITDLSAIADAASVRTVATLNPGYRDLSNGPSITALPAPRHFADPPHLARSFSKWWTAASRA